jgi:hypothetical protein
VNLDAGAGKKGNASAKSPLQPIVPAGIEEDAEENENGRGDEKVQEANDPEKCASKREQGALHM